MTGKVYLVGAGPGDVGLFTLRGAELLQKAEVVVYDRLVGEDILALIPASVKMVDVGKSAQRHSVPQEQINKILVHEAQTHQVVVRLKGGDPFLFGRGGEEAEMLAAHGIPFEAVPGVTSAIAAPAYAGIPATHRDHSSSLHIITGHGQRNQALTLDYAALAQVGGTLVFLMSLASAPEIVRGLLGAGMKQHTPAAVVENGTTAGQRSFTGTLAELPQLIAENQVAPPAVIIVGEVCTLAAQLDWFSQRPLSGCRVLVTRPREVAAGFGASLRELGAAVSYYPCIHTSPLDYAIDLAGLDWLVFTSAAGVEVFFARLRDTGRDSRVLGSAKIAVVGEKTADALQNYGICADFMPTVYDGKHLARELIQGGYVTAGQHIALFRAKQGGEDIAEILRGAGLTVTDVPIYETIAAARLPAQADAFDYITFTSASCVDNFINANRQLDFSHLIAMCIGTQTAAAAAAAGMRTIISDKATTASMAEKLQEVWHEHQTQKASAQ